MIQWGRIYTNETGSEFSGTVTRNVSFQSLAITIATCRENADIINLPTTTKGSFTYSIKDRNASSSCHKRFEWISIGF